MKINDYDQIWFFGDWPGEFANDPNVNDAEIADPRNLPLSNEELKLIADWMDRGGGVFATGDHSLLGASMCHRIPRVRTMRRWTRAQQVPSFDGSDRHQTLVAAPGGQDAEEGDRWPQRIFPVLTPVFRGAFVYPSSPHPILCGRSAVIESFPDHMHEGGLFEDDEVALNTPLDIANYDRVEYPTVPPLVEAAMIGGTAAGEVAVLGFQPRPHVIAHGLTTNTDFVPRVFAMVGTYDGDPLGIGRVVVDSTWHHWFSLNLVGLRDLSPDVYAGMQDYYINIALWLSTPEQRASMLFAATWDVLVASQPGAFDVALGIRGIGERVVDVIGRSAPQCIFDELVATTAELPAARTTTPADDRWWLWAPSGSSLNTAIVGGIASRMIKQAHRHINEETRGQEPRLDAAAVRRLGLEGVAAGKHELVEGLSQGSERFAAMRDLLVEHGDRTSLGHIPIDGSD